MRPHEITVFVIALWAPLCFASDPANSTSTSINNNHLCETRLSRELAKCRRKVITPNHATQVRIVKSAHFAVENCTSELVPHMSAQDFLLKSIDEPDFKKSIGDCFSHRQIERLREYGIGDDYANLRYKKCVRDAIDHEKLHGHKKE